DHDDELTGTFYMVVIGLELADGLDAADAALDQARADARARASIPSLAYVAMHQAAVALRRGAVAVAEDEARTALALLTGHGLDLGVTFARAMLALALLGQGDVAGAAQACAYAGDVPSGLFDDELLRARAVVRSAQGDHDGGVAALRAYGARIEAGGGGANPLAHRWRSELAHVLVAAGDVPAARAVAAEDLERAQRWGAPPGIGRAQRALAAAADDEDERIALLRTAVDTLEPSVARLEHARALVELGAALRRGNHRADAREHLRAGVRIASACGATALAEHAALELRVAGGPSSNVHGTGADQLTVSERRVAELAAAGHSNPQIAQLLFVTRKTVETHLGRAYRKLDIAGRDQLAAALDES
ncbi:MAG TPA: LuxR C-terminal-related transcriptional regulator, partial [Baekduia sp.]|nr:LuxR C-terminal-related transcriptional regulator [Baekduia sp.]